MFNILQMKRQGINTQRKTSIFHKLSATGQTKKRYTNNFKVQNTSKPLKNLQGNIAQGSYKRRDLDISSKPLRRLSTEFQTDYTTTKEQRIGKNDQLLSANRYIQPLNQFSSEQYNLKGMNQISPVLSYSQNYLTLQVTELSGFKIVQNGLTIHDETYGDKSISTSNGQIPSIVTFTYEDKFKPYTESLLTIGPGSKLISLPNFIEAQE